MAFIGLNIKRQNLFPNNFWTPGGSQKGPTRVCPCVCPFIQTFSRKRIMRFIRSPVDAVRDKVGFFKKRPPKWDVFGIIEKFCRYFLFFFLFLVNNDILQYLLLFAVQISCLEWNMWQITLIQSDNRFFKSSVSRGRDYEIVLFFSC